MKKTLQVIGIIFFTIFFWAYKCDRQTQKESLEEANKPKEKISCIMCGKDLTDDYNRICPNGKGYFCTPCYEKTMRGVNSDIQSEGYSGSDISESSSTNKSQDESGYTTGSDGKIYENAACSLCGGTGIETATARNPATGEMESRVCPQCNGTGHQSY